MTTDTSYTIRANTDAFAPVENGLLAVKEALQEAMNVLDADMIDLEDNWEGRRKREFFRQWREARPRMEALHDVVEGLGEKIQHIAVEFVETDLTAAKSG